MRAVTVTDHFRSPKVEQEARLDWLRRHGFDPADVDLVVELRPGLFQVSGFDFEESRPPGIQRWSSEVMSEWPCPGLKSTGSR